MQARELLNLLTVAERLKDTTRHCYTSKGRRESVAEHSWMMTLMVFFMRDEFPEAGYGQGHSDVYHSRFGGSIHGGYSDV